MINIKIKITSNYITGSGFLSLHQLSAESLAEEWNYFICVNLVYKKHVALNNNIPSCDHLLFEIACKKPTHRGIGKIY